MMQQGGMPGGGGGPPIMVLSKFALSIMSKGEKNEPLVKLVCQSPISLSHVPYLDFPLKTILFLFCPCATSSRNNSCPIRFCFLVVN